MIKVTLIKQRLDFVDIALNKEIGIYEKVKDAEKQIKDELFKRDWHALKFYYNYDDKIEVLVDGVHDKLTTCIFVFSYEDVQNV